MRIQTMTVYPFSLEQKFTLQFPEQNHNSRDEKLNNQQPMKWKEITTSCSEIHKNKSDLMDVQQSELVRFGLCSSEVDHMERLRLESFLKVFQNKRACQESSRRTSEWRHFTIKSGGKWRADWNHGVFFQTSTGPSSQTDALGSTSSQINTDGIKHGARMRARRLRTTLSYLEIVHRMKN